MPEKFPESLIWLAIVAERAQRLEDDAAELREQVETMMELGCRDLAADEPPGYLAALMDEAQARIAAAQAHRDD